MIDWGLFKALPITEFLHQRWNKKGQGALFITKFIERFNFVSAWVGTELVKVRELKRRAKTMAHFFDIAAVS
jgi:hypothetical protein